jgi:alpha-tubulin suppressor-like RCC1 family protein
MRHQTRHQDPRPLARRLAATAAAVASVIAIALAPMPAASATAVHHPAATTVSGATVWGWGEDGTGQLGRSLAAGFSTVPVRARLPHGTRITSVRAGCFHTVALTASGQVLTWGSNSNGQLGRGKPGGVSATPAKVSFPPGTGRITAVRAGCAFSLALTADGDVLAWGDNFDGQIGIGTAGGFTPAPAVVRIPPGTTVKAISAGSEYSLALTTTGQVLAWGNNLMGQLGTRDTTSEPAPVPAILPPHTVVTAVAAGWTTSQVITRSGRVLGWGDGGSGQLGDGSTMGSLTPVPAMLPPGTRVTGLFAGCFSTVALTAAGKVLAWGNNSKGQLGNNSTKSSSRPVQARLPAGTRVTAISAGCQHVLARTASGRVLAWGSNGEGTVGDGTSAPFRRLPQRVKLPPGVTVFAVASGSRAVFSLAIG